MSYIQKLESYSTTSEYTWAWCTDCDRKWGGKDCSKIKDKARAHAKRTGHHVVVRFESMTEYNYVE